METDSELVALTRAGNKEAFGRLIERHQARAMRVALGMVPNRSLAEELVQEAMLQAYLSLDRLREEASFASWLHGIVLNVCRNHLRNQKQDGLFWEGPQWEASGLMPMAPDPAQIAEQRERERLVFDAVRTLSTPNRDATLLFYYEQLSLREIAASLAISPGAVKARLHQARKQLRQRLLPLYGESTMAMPARQRRRKMVDVRVTHVFPGRGDTLDREDPLTSERHAQHFIQRIVMSQSPTHPWDWVGLMEQEGHRFLPVQLGWDVRGLAAVLDGSVTDIAPPLALIDSLLKATDTRMEGVRLEPLTDDILHGVIEINRGATKREIPVRPGDGIALAVQTNSPVRVAEEIMAHSSWDLSNALSIVEQLQTVGDEASLRRATVQPLIVRVAQAIIDNGLRWILSHEGCTTGEIVLGPGQRPPWENLAMIYHAGDNELGRNPVLPEAALSVLIARFKLMANLNIMEHHARQQGPTLAQYKGEGYDLLVTTEPTSEGERLTLRLQRKAEQKNG